MNEDTTKDTIYHERVKVRPLAHHPVLASIIRAAVMAGGYENRGNIETVALAVLNAVGDLPDGHLKDEITLDLSVHDGVPALDVMTVYVERAMEVEYSGWVSSVPRRSH